MTQDVADYATLRSELLAQPVCEPPALESYSGPHTVIPLEDLVEAGALTVYEVPPTVGVEGGETPMLSAKDVRLGRAASRWGNAAEPGAVTIRTGDVAVAVSTEAAVRVCEDEGVLLGPGIRLVRADVNAVDPYFLAGILRAAINASDGRPLDLYEVAVPRIQLAEQRRYGAAFARLTALETAYQRQRADIERLVRTGFGGLAQGQLRPTTDDQ
ncbi:restriction endonuclease subunit S domain-containing protein [Nocardia aurantiaca]|uniref:Type I restriction modification DNA specificity domain-containing protein n=1 Tax=Nocardia aurantiaca TaxID=2675850 RepID=A0A6I3L0Q1_9NOCA|nr:hypothetical protein [Nocardia aurantiaca]MTE14134.1 hypothetical protein [Nocardia aurantiaca]